MEVMTRDTDDETDSEMSEKELIDADTSENEPIDFDKDDDTEDDMSETDEDTRLDISENEPIDFDKDDEMGYDTSEIDGYDGSEGLDKIDETEREINEVDGISPIDETESCSNRLGSDTDRIAETANDVMGETEGADTTSLPNSSVYLPTSKTLTSFNPPVLLSHSVFNGSYS
jgi:hypothetical protein